MTKAPRPRPPLPDPTPGLVAGLTFDKWRNARPDHVARQFAEWERAEIARLRARIAAIDAAKAAGGRPAGLLAARGRGSVASPAARLLRLPEAILARPGESAAEYVARRRAVANPAR